MYVRFSLNTCFMYYICEYQMNVFLFPFLRIFEYMHTGLSIRLVLFNHLINYIIYSKFLWFLHLHIKLWKIVFKSQLQFFFFRRKKSRSPFEEFEIDVGSPFMASCNCLYVFFNSSSSNIYHIWFYSSVHNNLNSK